MAAADSPEESSWTFYIDGFICDQNNKSCFSSEFESPSLVSDAASSLPLKNKLPNNCNWTQGFSSAAAAKNITTIMSNSNQNTNFKKQKTKIIPTMVECDLEDTASSPVNSPKVSYMNEFMITRDDKKQKAKMEVISEVKMRNSFGKVFAVEKDNNLKKKSSTSTCGCGHED